MFGLGKYLPARHDSDILAPPGRDFERFFEDWPRLLAWPASWPSLERLQTTFMPALDVRDTDKNVEITCELPGLTDKDINVEVDRNVLTISGEKKCEHEEKSEGKYRCERSYGSFSRSVQLPEGVEEDKINAQFKNGILTVILPKGSDYERKRRKIEVRTEA